MFARSPMPPATRAWALAVGFFLAGPAFARHDFVAENLVAFFDAGPSNIDEATFDAILESTRTALEPVAQANSNRLVIGGFWDDDTINANAQQQIGKVIVTVYGGIARRPEVTPDALALVLCHEIGHAFGGKPYKGLIFPFRMSVEGQSDYWGMQDCLPRVLRELPPQDLPESARPAPATREFIERTCASHAPGLDDSHEICVRQLAAGDALGHLLSFMKNQPVPDYTTPDPTRVNRTESSHPKTIQCRLDTYLAAVLGRPRPACWYRG